MRNDIYGRLMVYTKKRDAVLERAFKVRDKLEMRVYSAGAITKSVALTHRMLFDEQNRALYSNMQKEGRRSWRRFSIKDIVALKALIELNAKGLTFKRSSPVFHWLTKDLDWINSFLIDYADGQEVFIYFAIDGFKKLYGSQQKQEFLNDLDKSKEPIIVLRMNYIITWALTTFARSDFRITVRDNDSIIFHVDNKEIVIGRLPELPKIIHKKGG